MHVLIVDDNAINRKVLHRQLNRIGFVDVDMAENGEIAVSKCRSKEYDVIFMDIQMPVMDGFTATQVILNEAGSGGSISPSHPSSPSDSSSPPLLVSSLSLSSFSSTSSLHTSSEVNEESLSGCEVPSLIGSKQTKRHNVIHSPPSLYTPSSQLDDVCEDDEEESLIEPTDDIATDPRKEKDQPKIFPSLSRCSGSMSDLRQNRLQHDEENEYVPVIIGVSASVFAVTRRRCMEVGMATILMKPLSINDLRTAIVGLM